MRLSSAILTATLRRYRWPCADELPLRAPRGTSSLLDSERYVVVWLESGSAASKAARFRALRTRASCALPMALAGW
jgi:hypothetical protein